MKVSNYTNLYSYGEKERKSPWENDDDQEYSWTDVVARFERKYGKGTFDTSLLNDGRGTQKIYDIDELASIMGVDKKE